jgi:hypothetical protein
VSALAKGALATVRVVAKRPLLWPTAWRECRALTPTRWWRRWPPAPAPAGEYLAFRMQTMYGLSDRAPGPEELVAYLEWCRWMRCRAR